MSSITSEVDEKSTLPLTIVVTDANGIVVTPLTAIWALTDTSGNAINKRMAVHLTPSTSMSIVLAGDDLQIVDDTKERELRVLTVFTDRGSADLPENIQVKFWIKNLVVTS